MEINKGRVASAPPTDGRKSFDALVAKIAKWQLGRDHDDRSILHGYATQRILFPKQRIKKGRSQSTFSQRKGLIDR